MKIKSVVYFLSILLLFLVLQAYGQKNEEVSFPKKDFQFVLDGISKGDSLVVGQFVNDYVRNKWEAPTVTIIKRSNLAIQKEITLKVNPSPDQPKNTFLKHVKHLVSDKRGNYYLIYDVVWSGGGFLLCQKYGPDFQPVGNSLSLMDKNIDKGNNSGYDTRVIFNNDSSRIGIYQAGQYFGSQAKLSVYDNTFKKLKEYSVNQYLTTKTATVRNILMNKDIISIIVSGCSDPSRGAAGIKCPLYCIDIDTGTDKSEVFLDNNFFSENNYKTKSFASIPGKSTHFVAMLNNRNIEKNPPQSNTFMLLEKKGGVISKVQEWTIDKEKQKSPEGTTFCFDDIFSGGEFTILPMANNKGYYLVTLRNYLFNACDIGGQKEWQYFFVMVLDQNGKFVKDKFFPIHKPTNPMIADDANIECKVVGQELIVWGNYSENHYLKGAPLDKKTVDNVPAILKITPDLNFKFYKVADAPQHPHGPLLYVGSGEVIGFVEEQIKGEANMNRKNLASPQRKLIKVKF